MSQCSCKTDKGNRCTFKARPGEKYCGKHIDGKCKNGDYDGAGPSSGHGVASVAPLEISKGAPKSKSIVKVKKNHKDTLPTPNILPESQSESKKGIALFTEFRTFAKEIIRDFQKSLPENNRPMFSNDHDMVYEYNEDVVYDDDIDLEGDEELASTNIEVWKDGNGYYEILITADYETDIKVLETALEGITIRFPDIKDRLVSIEYDFDINTSRSMAKFSSINRRVKSFIKPDTLTSFYPAFLSDIDSRFLASQSKLKIIELKNFFHDIFDAVEKKMFDDNMKSSTLRLPYTESANIVLFRRLKLSLDFIKNMLIFGSIKQLLTGRNQFDGIFQDQVLNLLVQFNADINKKILDIKNELLDRLTEFLRIDHVSRLPVNIKKNIAIKFIKDYLKDNNIRFDIFSIRKITATYNRQTFRFEFNVE